MKILILFTNNSCNWDKIYWETKRFFEKKLILFSINIINNLQDKILESEKEINCQASRQSWASYLNIYNGTFIVGLAKTVLFCWLIYEKIASIVLFYEIALFCIVFYPWKNFLSSIESSTQSFYYRFMIPIIHFPCYNALLFF